MAGRWADSARRQQDSDHHSSHLTCFLGREPGGGTPRAVPTSHTQPYRMSARRGKRSQGKCSLGQTLSRGWSSLLKGSQQDIVSDWVSHEIFQMARLKGDRYSDHKSQLASTCPPQALGGTRLGYKRCLPSLKGQEDSEVNSLPHTNHQWQSAP